MADAKHLAQLAKGRDAWNSWRSDNPNLIPDLRCCREPFGSLAFFDLHNVEFSESDLRGIDFWSADLYQAEFYRADLRGCRLTGADLRGAKFDRADLRGASLKRTDLYRVDFIGTRLDGASFQGARCLDTAFSNVDLSMVDGLSDIVHSGPSNIDIATLVNSRDHLPRGFLEDAGVPSVLLDYLPSVLFADQVVQFHSCFISYSHDDELFARSLYRRLREANIRVWFAPEDLRGGKKLSDQVEGAIQLHDRLLVILSASSMRSRWVETEIRRAIDREIRSGKRVLFPVRIASFEEVRSWRCFDADSGRDIAAEIREYFIPDFSNWRDELSFAASFERLLADLKAEESSSRGAI